MGRERIDSWGFGFRVRCGDYRPGGWVVGEACNRVEKGLASW